MDFTLASIDAREKGQVPISIGTALAIESACGIYPDKPVNPPPLTQVKQLWINLRTLIRNLAGCLPAEVKDVVLPDHLHTVVLEEMAVIKATISKVSGDKTQVVFYACDYGKLKRRFPNATLRELRTEKQRMQHEVEERALELVLGDHAGHRIQLFDFELSGHFPHSFIITHCPVDLLSRYSFQKLELLESHTGAIKGPAAWHTKLTNGKELHNVPFNAFTLQLFGDNSTQFSAKGIVVRRRLLEQAVKDHWTNVSSLDRIKASIKKLEDQAVKDELNSLL